MRAQYIKSGGSVVTDVGSALLQAFSGFASSQLGKAAGTTLKDTGSLISSLRDGTPNVSLKTRLEQLKTDVTSMADLAKPVIAAVEPKTAVIQKMAQESAAEVQTDPFTAASAGRVATNVATALIALDEAVEVIATKVAAGDKTIHDAIVGIKEPWIAPFRSLGAGTTKAFDSFASQVLGIDNAARGLASDLSFDRVNFRLAFKLVGVASKSVGGGLSLTSSTLEAFLSFQRRVVVNPTEAEKRGLVERDGTWYAADQAVLGLRLFTTLQPGLTGDPLLKQVIPGSPAPAQTTPTTITLDSAGGLHLGDGGTNEKAVLPVQFDAPGVELRELALGVVRNAAKQPTGLEVTVVVAGKIGSVVGLVVSGAGVTIGLDGAPTADAAFAMVVAPRLPDAAGVRIDAAVVRGGGYLYRKGSEYGGALQLEFAKVGVYAIGILGTDPFSLVLVMGVHFPAAIELSFGFTFNGIGGILAIDRTVATDELRKGMREHVIDNLLFPDDPIAQAPKILGQLGKVFPARPGGFVIGPIIELGWGSQAKIIEAKLGIVLSLPDPKVLILGALRVRAPSKVTPLTDFRVEVFGEITTDHLLLIATLQDSKIAGIPVSGDLGLLLAWGGGGAFALSVGGFHPHYAEKPAELADLRRLTIDLSPPKVVKIVVQAYFAVTAGAIMAGVHGEFKADIGVASGRAWLTLDAIFRWAPRFGFEVNLSLGIDIEVAGFSFASISFSGVLEGTRPWRVQGTATVDVWFLPTLHFDLGPITWGEGALPAPAEVDPLETVKEALSAIEAWKAQLPGDADLLVQLAPAPDAVGLVAHPLAGLEVTQARVPLETEIARIGSAPVSAYRVHLGLPTTGGVPVAAVSTVTAPFAPGQFLALKDDALLSRPGFEQLPSGCRMAAATTPVTERPAAASVVWHTYFRDEKQEALIGAFRMSHASASVALDHGLVGRALRDRGNPYLPRTVTAGLTPSPDGPIVSMARAGTVSLHRAEDGGAVLSALGALTTTEASRIMGVLADAGEPAVTRLSVGVAP